MGLREKVLDVLKKAEHPLNHHEIDDIIGNQGLKHMQLQKKNELEVVKILNQLTHEGIVEQEMQTYKLK